MAQPTTTNTNNNNNVIPEDITSDEVIVEWNYAIETLIREQGEKALSYSWLHNRCEKKFSRLNNFIAIPVIILSTLAGSLSIGSNQFGENKYVAIGIGLLSIFTGILSTINSYFSWAKRAESHRISSLNYSKLYLFISFELSLPRDKRMSAKDFIKVIREQIERLNEISPSVSDDVILQFRRAFDGKYENVSRPEITNGLVSIRIYTENHLDRTSSASSGPSIPVIPQSQPLTQVQSPTQLPQVPAARNLSSVDVKTILSDARQNIYHL